MALGQSAASPSSRSLRVVLDWRASSCAASLDGAELLSGTAETQAVIMERIEIDFILRGAVWNIDGGKLRELVIILDLLLY